MSDVNDSPQGDEQDNEQPQGEAIDTTEPQGDEVAKIKAESRKWEARAKKDRDELTALRAKINQMVSPDAVAEKDSALTEAEAKIQTAELQLLRYRVALAEGLPQDLAERLLGNSEDEIREDAERLKALLKPAVPAKDAKNGQMSKAPETKPDANELFRYLAKR